MLFRSLMCVVGGALGYVALVWNLADTFAALMATINLVAIIPLGGLAIKMLKDYEAQRKQGRDPVFHASSLPEAKGVELWREGETTAMRTVPGDPAGGEYWPGRQRQNRRPGGSHKA